MIRNVQAAQAVEALKPTQVVDETAYATASPPDFNSFDALHRVDALLELIWCAAIGNTGLMTPDEAIGAAATMARELVAKVESNLGGCRL